LAEHLPEPERAEVLIAAWHTVRSIPLENTHLHAAARLAAHPLPEALHEAILARVAATPGNAYGSGVITALAPQLTEAGLEAALTLTRQWEIGHRFEPLLALAARLPAEEQAAVLAEAAAAARASEHAGMRVLALKRVAANAPAALRPAALDEAVRAGRAMQLPQLRVPWLAEFAEMEEDQTARERLLAEALGAVAEIADETNRVEALAKLAPPLPGNLLPEALEIASNLERDYDRGKAIVGLAPYLLEQDTWQAALALARGLEFNEPRATALAALAAVRPAAERGQLLEEALALAERLDEDDQPRALLQMAASLMAPEKLDVLRRALEMVEAPNAVTDVHAALLAALPEAERLPYAQGLLGRIRAARTEVQAELLKRVRVALPEPALAEALEVAAAASDLETLRFAAPRWVEICRAGGVDPLRALTRALQAGAQVARRDLLPLLADLAPALAAVGGAAAAQEAAQAVVETGEWWP
jgi:hypothetical protein